MATLTQFVARSLVVTERLAAEARAKWIARLPEIRRDRAAGKSFKEIGRKYGVRGEHIRKVLAVHRDEPQDLLEDWNDRLKIAAAMANDRPKYKVPRFDTHRRTK